MCHHKQPRLRLVPRDETWFERQFRDSAYRLAAADPAHLSNQGRAIRARAIAALNIDTVNQGCTD